MEEHKPQLEHDDHLRYLFEEAEVAPSVAVWKRIEDRLNETGKNPVKFIWLKRLFVLMVVIASLFALREYRSHLARILPKEQSQTAHDSIHSIHPVKPNNNQNSSTSSIRHDENAPSAQHIPSINDQTDSVEQVHSRLPSGSMTANAAPEPSADTSRASMSTAHWMHDSTMVIPSRNEVVQTPHPRNNASFSVHNVPEPNLTLFASSDIQKSTSSRARPALNTPYPVPANRIRHMVSLTISPDYVNNTIRDDSGLGVQDEQQHGRYTFSLRYLRSLKHHLSILTGLSYSSYHQQLNNHPVTFNRFITAPFIFHSSLGEMPVDTAVMKDGFNPPLPNFPKVFSFNYNYTQRLQFIKIPLQASLDFQYNKMTYSLICGVAVQYLVKQSTTLHLVKEHQTNTVTYTDLPVNAFSLQGFAGFGVSYPVKPGLFILAEPHARLNLTRINRNKQVDATPFFAGINIGMGLAF